MDPLPNAALTLVAPPRIADRRPFLATRPGFRSHYEIRLTAFYLSRRHRRHRPRRRSTGDCMLSSLALRSFIFHPNQWLVVKATRQAPAKPAYPPRPPCARKFFATLPGGGKTFFRALFALDGLARNQPVTRSTGSFAFEGISIKRRLLSCGVDHRHG